VIRKFCGFCGIDTWQNPCGKVVKDKERTYRCTSCGMPRRGTCQKQTIKLVPGGRPMVVVGAGY
jgi:hypothetical protein